MTEASKRPFSQKIEEYHDRQTLAPASTIRVPNDIWLGYCKEAIQANDRDSLNKFTGWTRDLPFPFDSFQPQQYGIFTANCALAAIELLKVVHKVPADDSSSQGSYEAFCEFIRHALVAKTELNGGGRIAIDFNRVTQLPDRFQEVKPFVNDLFGSEELLDVRDLIYFFADVRDDVDRKSRVQTSFPTVVSGEHAGKVCGFVVEKIKEGNGRLYMNVLKMGGIDVEPCFRKSIEDAFKYVNKNGKGLASNFDYRWYVENGSDHRITGPSVGLAAAVAFHYQFATRSFYFPLGRKIFLSALKGGYAFTGEVRVTDDEAEVTQVDGVSTKADLLKKCKFFVPHENYARLSSEDLARQKTNECDVVSSTTVREVIKRIDTDNRQRAWTYLGCTLIAVLVLFWIGIWLYGTYHTSQVAAAGKQVADAASLAAKGYKALGEGDRLTARAYFAKALTLNDQDVYREGLLAAYFDKGDPSFGLKWQKQLESGSRATLGASGEVFATLSPDGRTVRLFKTSDETEIRTLNFEYTIVSFALSSEGRYLGTKDNIGVVRIYDSSTDQETYRFNAEPDAAFVSLAFSGDDQHFAFISGTRDVYVYEIEKGLTLHFNVDNYQVYTASDRKLVTLSFIKNTHIAFAFPDQIIVKSLLDLRKSRMIHISGDYMSLGSTKDGELISSTEDGAEIYRSILAAPLSSGPLYPVQLDQLASEGLFIASNQYLPYFATVGAAGTLNFWKGTRAVYRSPLVLGAPTPDFMLASNGRLLIRTSDDRVFCFEEIPSNVKSFNTAGQANYFSGVGKQRVLKLDRDKIVVNEIGPDEDRTILTLKSTGAATISPDMSALFTSEDGKSLDIYDLDTGKRSGHFDIYQDSSNPILFLVVSNQNNMVALVRSNSIDLFDITAGKLLWSMEFDEKVMLDRIASGIISLTEFTAKDTYLYFPTEYSVVLIDPSTGTVKHVIPFSFDTTGGCPKDETGCYQFNISPDEKIVSVTDKFTGKVELWALEPYRHLLQVFMPIGKGSEVAIGPGFSVDGRFVIWTGGHNGLIHFFDLKQGRMRPDLRIGEQIHEIVVTKSNQLIVTGNNYYSIDLKSITDKFDQSPEMIYSEIVNDAGVKVEPDITAKFSQEQLMSLLPDGGSPSFHPAVTDTAVFPKASSALTGTVRTLSEKRGRPLSSKADPYPANASAKPETGWPCETGSLGPALNMFFLTFDDYDTPWCSDFPIVDVALDTPNPRFSQSESDYLAVRRFRKGDQLVVMLYADNGAYNPPVGLTANNVEASTYIETEGNLHKITTEFSGDNFAGVIGSVRIQLADDEELEIIPGSSFMYNFEGRIILDRQDNQQMEWVTYGEVPRSVVHHIGDLAPGWEYSVFITFKMRVVAKAN